VEVLKAIAAEIETQRAIAGAVAQSDSSDMDSLRRDQIEKLSAALGEMPAELTAATKDSLKYMNDPNLYTALLQKIDKTKGALPPFLTFR
jgi:hypothetical protein